MIRRKYILISTVLALITAVSIIMYFGYFYTMSIFPNSPDIFKKYIDKNTDISIRYETVSGNFNDGFIIKNLLVNSESDTILYSKILSVNLNPIPILFKKFSISNIDLSGGLLHITRDNINHFIPSESILPGSFNYAVSIDHFRVSDFKLSSRSNELVLSETVCSIQYDDSLTINDFSSSIIYHNDRVRITNSDLNIIDNLFSINNLKIQSDISGNPKGIFNLTGVWNTHGFNWSARIDGSLKYFGQNFIFPGIEFSGTSEFLQIEDSEISMNGDYIDISGKFSSEDKQWQVFALSKFAEFTLDSMECSLGGQFSLSGSWPIKKATLSFSKSNVAYDQYFIDEITGAIEITKKQIINSGFIQFDLPNGSLMLDSLIYNNNQDYFIHGQVAFSDLSPNKYFHMLPFVRLSGVGEIRYRQNSNISLLDTRATFKPFNYKSLNLGDSYWETSAVLEGYKLKSLVLSAVTDTMNYLFMDMNYSKVLAEYRDGNIKLHELHGENSNNDHYFVSGSIDTSLQHIRIDSLSTRLKSNEAVVENLNIFRKDGIYVVDSSIVNINNTPTRISGNYFNKDQFEVNLGFENFALDKIENFIYNKSILTGQLSGNIHFNTSEGIPRLEIQSKVKDGKISDFAFDEINGNLTLKKNKLLITNLTISSEILNADMSGWLNINEDRIKSQTPLARIKSMILESNITNSNLDYFSKYFPWRFKTSGTVSGKILVSGSPENLYFNSNIIIIDPVFDKIRGTSAEGNLVYKNRRLNFIESTISLPHGKYSVQGSLPVNLDLLYRGDKKQRDDSMHIFVEGQANELEFFYPYFAITDTLTCDCYMDLSITGTYANPIRNGKAVIKDGRITFLPLSNPITQVDGEISIDDNLLTINNFRGLSVAVENITSQNRLGFFKKFTKNKAKKTMQKQNLSISGTMDMSSFFRPNFNLLLSGRNVFIKDSQSEFSGPGNITISVSGQDTLTVSGEFQPDSYEFAYSPQFSIEEIPGISDKSGVNPVIIYDIHLPMENGIKVKNEFMDLEVEGDVNLTAIGDEEFRIGGNVYVSDGTFYLNGNEFSPTEGQLVFDPGSDFPIINITSFTDINGKIYKINISGTLENPVLGFESELPGDSYTQDEILKILLARDESVISGNKFNIQNTGTNFVSNYLENELEKYISKNSPIDKFQIDSQGTLLSDPTNSEINVYLGKRLSRKIYMNIKSDIFSEQIRNEYEVIYRIDRSQSVVVRLDDEGLPHLNYRFKLVY